MLDRIIKFLGGFTREEYNLLQIEKDSYKSSSDSFKGQLIQAEKYFEFMHDDATAFKEIVKHQIGMVGSETVPNTNNYEPIKTRPLSVTSLMREMAADDRKRARSEFPKPEDLPA